MKKVILNYNSTISDLERLKVGNRITIEKEGKTGGLFSIEKKKTPEGKFLYKLTLLKDSGLLTEVYLLRPTTDQI